MWQIAAGASGRFYTDLFLKHDIMFMGPGYYGPFSWDTYGPVVQKGWESGGIINQIASFHDNVQPGDIVLMRNGHCVRAIGIVHDSPYEWSATFDDVYGWGLEHTRRVIWQEQFADDLEKLQRSSPLFSSRKQIPTFTRVHDVAILNPLHSLLSQFADRKLKPLPLAPPPTLTPEELGQQLFAKGVANDAVDKVLSAITRQRRLLEWYRQFGWDSGRPTEHEVVAHMILPLLLALGWSEQLLAVEWRKIDLAAFWATPTTPEHCILVCEAKSSGHGLQDVRDQAFNYISTFELKECRKVLLTEGGRFYLYQRTKGRWNEDASAVGYLNIDKIRTNHLAPPGTSAVDTIVALTPTGAVRDSADHLK